MAGPVRKVTFWAKNRLYVDLVENADGSVAFHGQDLNGAEYEYVLTVAVSQLPALRAALKRHRSKNLLAALCREADSIMAVGEQRWLRSHGIEPEIWNHFDV